MALLSFCSMIIQTHHNLAMFIELPPDRWACCYSTALEGARHSDNVTK